ncbi:hypothetical protein C3F00_034535 [Pseudomonas sp. MWU13-2860]|nr:hypothetical protein C3F00_034535 [Pseudomonas sp. MWU13-2860]
MGEPDGYSLVSGPKLGRAVMADHGAFNYRRDQDQPGVADQITVRVRKGAQTRDVVVQLLATPVNMSDEACWARAG